MHIDAKDVMKLRKQTGAGMMECKNALKEAEGDNEKAIDILRAKLGKKAAKRAGRATSEGAIGHYIHIDHKQAGMVELQCETDFVARNDDFRELAAQLALHVVVAHPEPLFLERDEVPEALLERERAVYREQVKDKPEQIQDKIIEGKVASWFKEHVFLDQVFAMDADAGSVREVIKTASAKTGENIRLARYAKFVVGAGSDD